MQVSKIDEKGFYVESVIIDDIDNLPHNLIADEVPEGIYKPKWNGLEWVEDLTSEEIDDIKNEPKPPTDQERINMLENMILIIMEG